MLAESQARCDTLASLSYHEDAHLLQRKKVLLVRELSGGHVLVPRGAVLGRGLTPPQCRSPGKDRACLSGTSPTPTQSGQGDLFRAALALGAALAEPRAVCSWFRYLLLCSPELCGEGWYFCPQFTDEDTEAQRGPTARGWRSGVLPTFSRGLPAQVTCQGSDAVHVVPPVGFPGGDGDH